MKKFALLLAAALVLTLVGCGAAPEAKDAAQEGIYLNQKLDSPSVSVLTDTQTMLTREEAKAIAFAHAGVTDAFDVEIELDKEKTVYVYEVDFETKDAEYDYEIEAYTGEVLKSKKEEKKAVTPAPEAPVTPAPETSGTKLTREEAKAIALNHAGVTPSRVEVELDKDDGVTKYEIEFKHGGYEYDYEIEAYTGEILKSEKEWDD